MGKTPKRPMTSEEIAAIKMMRGVTFPVASFDKRFARHLMNQIEAPPAPVCTCSLSQIDMLESGVHYENCDVRTTPPWQPMLSDKEMPQLWRVFRRYRRQLPAGPERVELLRLAEALTAPEFRSAKYKKTQEMMRKLEEHRKQHGVKT